VKLFSTLGICTILFAVLGPLAGGVFFFAWMALSTGISSLSDLLSPGMSLVYVFLVVGAYLLGSVPAAATGLVFGLIVSWRALGRLLCTVLGAALGGLVCLLFQGVLSILHGGGTSFDWVITLAGAFSGFSCGLLCSLVWVGPNNSFKPKPLRGSA
jgi:hypothetical protein